MFNCCVINEYYTVTLSALIEFVGKGFLLTRFISLEIRTCGGKLLYTLDKESHVDQSSPRSIIVGKEMFPRKRPKIRRGRRLPRQNFPYEPFPSKVSKETYSLRVFGCFLVILAQGNMGVSSSDVLVLILKLPRANN